ncbi:hypothetical protein F1559_003965 [Cyanidiococcus yangmingshanensis]|uniref:Uncharacterized protein n=1 Tax=Cyanidiococcus yangmingshanensis TaxID=2690220 RepID=A0A7J7IJ11_9RHOD|nr:hypothetical protein F1559_003965 [Cyanidiococcus yangmingshanensis]
MDRDQGVMASVPEALQGLYPFFARGREVEHLEPVVSYFTRLYAVEQGLGIRRQLIDASEQKRVAVFLMDEMNGLESLKKRVLSSSEWSSIFRHEAFDYMHRFALRIFERAEREERRLQPTVDTAAKFYAASIFLQALEQFRLSDGASSRETYIDAEDTSAFWEQLSQQIRYAQYRCVSIRKALRETPRAQETGRPANGGRLASVSDPDSIAKDALPYGEKRDAGIGSRGVPESLETDETVSLDADPKSATIGHSSSTPIVSVRSAKNGPVAAERNGPRYQESDQAGNGADQSPCSPGHGVAVGTRQAFRRHVRSALSAIEFDDDETAAKELREALALLTPLDAPRESSAVDAVVSLETRRSESSAP